MGAFKSVTGLFWFTLREASNVTEEFGGVLPHKSTWIYKPVKGAKVRIYPPKAGSPRSRGRVFF
jgi:hypothetical protein